MSLDRPVLIDPERYHAFAALLALPDPAEMPKRGFRVTQPSDPTMRATDELWRRWVIAWSQRWKLERVGGEAEPGRAVRVPKPRYWILARERLL